MRQFRHKSIDFSLTSNYLKTLKHEPFLQPFQFNKFCKSNAREQPRHLICFKQWTAKMVLDVIYSAMNLKFRMRDTHHQNLKVLPNTKVMILQEINEPMLSMAVSKAASLLGAVDVGVTDSLVWDYDYHGRIFSEMADIIFVATNTHTCLQRFADMSSVPVMCMVSRTHASIQSLATVMAIMETFSSMRKLNIAYVGPPHPVLNSYLLLCPLLGANIKFKCGCKIRPASPILMQISKEMTQKFCTETKQCTEACDALANASVVIAGPTCTIKDAIPEFKLDICELNQKCCCDWIFFHTCPRGNEVDDTLFWSGKSRTFNAFQNLHYIAAALIAYHVGDYKFY